MEIFCDVFDYPHKLIVRGWQDHVSCHKVANGRRSIAETERKHCQGAPYVVFRRDVSFSGKLRHVIGVGKGEAALVLPGLLGSKGGIELALKPLVVEDDGGGEIGWRREPMPTLLPP